MQRECDGRCGFSQRLLPRIEQRCLSLVRSLPQYAVVGFRPHALGDGVYRSNFQRLSMPPGLFWVQVW
jgi:hypothetical protein